MKLVLYQQKACTTCVDKLLWETFCEGKDSQSQVSAYADILEHLDYLLKWLNKLTEILNMITPDRVCNIVASDFMGKP